MAIALRSRRKAFAYWVRSCTLRSGHGRALELRFLGRALQRGGGGLPLLDRLGHRVEVAGAHLALMLHRGEAAFGGGEFLLLQFHEAAPLAAHIVAPPRR